MEIPEGKSPKLYSTISVPCQRGRCAHCPRVVAAPGIGSPITCIHDCHKKPSWARGALVSAGGRGG